jgi:hypothetical protein
MANYNLDSENSVDNYVYPIDEKMGIDLDKISDLDDAPLDSNETLSYSSII